MAKRYRLTGLPKGAVDTQEREIQFELSVAHERPLSFVARYGPAAQVISGLGRMLAELRRVLDEAKGMESTAAEAVATVQVQRDRWHDVVLVHLTTPEGVPYTFALPPQVAIGIADQLKTESAKPHQTGNA